MTSNNFASIINTLATGSTGADEMSEAVEVDLELHHRRLSPEQLSRFEEYASEIFGALGMDVDTPSTRETPHRFITALIDATSGYEGDPNLVTVFDAENGAVPSNGLSQVIEGPINIFSLCEHHALPI